MGKKKSLFVCSECGCESTGWLGKCPACNGWNTFIEEIQNKKVKTESGFKDVKPVSITDISMENEKRDSTGIKELDRVLGGGIVCGSLILVGGDPGIGKSTLLLQICESKKSGGRILYISGEESIKQIKLRADRLGVKNPGLLLVSETNYSVVQKVICDVKPGFAVIDSIQTMYNDELASAPGSVSQVRDVTAGLMKIAKNNGITIFIVGHVTKEGAIAGPRVLEHMVDTVLYFEGDRHLNYRVLRAVKNRYGSTNEIGIFEMRDTGLVEVGNPSMMLLSGRPKNVPGSVVVSGIEGTRPMLMEIQALICASGFGMPRRLATGVDHNRVALLMAVLEKRVGMQMSGLDAYVNVIGGLKIDEPACDLGIMAAIASSFRNKAVDPETVLIGEVGLTGEIRTVNQIEKRVVEAVRIGFKRCMIPDGNLKILKQAIDTAGVDIAAVSNIGEALEILSGH